MIVIIQNCTGGPDQGNKNKLINKTIIAKEKLSYSILICRKFLKINKLIELREFSITAP